MVNYLISNKIKFYSFSKQDLVIVLSLDNAAFLLLSAVINGHPLTCFTIAVLFSLIVLFAIVWIGLARTVDEEGVKLEHEQELIRKRIRNEYEKVHKMKRGHELLKQAGCFSQEQQDSVLQTDLLNKDFEKINEVHFNYLNDLIPQENTRDQPEGS